MTAPTNPRPVAVEEGALARGTGESLHTRMARVSARMALAAKHEALALDLAEHVDRGSVTKAAAHFTVADALRSRARSV